MVRGFVVVRIDIHMKPLKDWSLSLHSKVLRVFLDIYWSIHFSYILPYSLLPHHDESICGFKLDRIFCNLDLLLHERFLVGQVAHEYLNIS